MISTSIHRHQPAPIHLATLDSKPSWVNLVGRVDRSACLEISASQLWRRCEFQRSRSAPRKSAGSATRGRSHITTSREAVGKLTISASDLASLLFRRPPRKLSGDWRTAKANAMKRAHDANGQGLPRRHPGHGGKQKRLTLDHFLEPNPNAGRSRAKVLGIGEQERARGEEQESGVRGQDSSICNPQSLPLPSRWSQTLTIERWRQHAKLAQHFLLCPCCKQKATKLFMPMCTPDELRDARLAQQWLSWNHSTSPSSRASDLACAYTSRLLARYALLFHPRSPLCRKCLGLRYGTGNRHQRADSFELYAARAWVLRFIDSLRRVELVREAYKKYQVQADELNARLQAKNTKRNRRAMGRLMTKLVNDLNRTINAIEGEHRAKRRRMTITKAKLRAHAKAQAARRSRIAMHPQIKKHAV